MEQAKMEDFVANAALLAAHLTQQCEKAVSDQQAVIRDLRETVNTVSSGVAAGQAALAQQLRGAVAEALAREVTEVSRTLLSTADQLREMAAQSRYEQSSIALRMRFLSWTSIASLCFAAALAIGGTAYIAWSNLQRAAQAQVRTEVLQALNHVTITSCDGRPCVKLEDGLQRWSKNDEYVLVDGSHGPGGVAE